MTRDQSWPADLDARAAEDLRREYRGRPIGAKAPRRAWTERIESKVKTMKEKNREREHRMVLQALAFTPTAPKRSKTDDAMEASVRESDAEYERSLVRQALAEAERGGTK